AVHSLFSFPDVGDVARIGARSHPDVHVRASDVWQGGRPATEAGLDPQRKRPAELNVLLLQRSLRVEVDGQLYTQGWRRALDLFLYFAQQPDGGTALEIASRLWGGEQVSKGALQQRFHSMLSALR